MSAAKEGRIDSLTVDVTAVPGCNRLLASTTIQLSNSMGMSCNCNTQWIRVAKDYAWLDSRPGRKEHQPLLQ